MQVTARCQTCGCTIPWREAYMVEAGAGGYFACGKCAPAGSTPLADARAEDAEARRA